MEFATISPSQSMSLYRHHDALALHMNWECQNPLPWNLILDDNVQYLELLEILRYSQRYLHDLFIFNYVQLLAYAITDGWSEITRTLVPWRQGYNHPIKNRCLGWFALPTIDQGLKTKYLSIFYFGITLGVTSQNREAT